MDVRVPMSESQELSQAAAIRFVCVCVCVRRRPRVSNRLLQLKYGFHNCSAFLTTRSCSVSVTVMNGRVLFSFGFRRWSLRWPRVRVMQSCSPCSCNIIFQDLPSCSFMFALDVQRVLIMNGAEKWTWRNADNFGWNWRSWTDWWRLLNWHISSVYGEKNNWCWQDTFLIST